MSATAGGPATAADQLESLRIPVTGYCYRMLGSAADADDAAQETLIRAYTRFDSYDPSRARLSTWVHAIATNICLDMLRSARRRMLFWEGPDATGFDPDAVLPPDRWIDPIPDSRVLDPADRIVRRESVRLAFVAALQHLPPRQRAVLVLRDVLAFSAAETAQMLEVGPAAVNSALQRARATLSSVPEQATEVLDPENPRDREVISRYVAAFENHDVEGLAALLCEDARSGMPPLAWRLSGRDTIVAVFAAGDACAGDRLVPVAMNGSIGFGQYRPDPDGVLRPFALLALGARSGLVAQQITYFGSGDRFAEFGLPPTVDSAAHR
ncbi:RNA polymerase subunit sigma-70 [Nocardia veterana]|uniref:RNA polymerase subunit sigma-70 n=1 Tax=Nocardia veterana TaxID=132249 RepID=A0A7X6RJM3_9NOCA|nr:RNA polymerase subunit sigma-70 [Nocardia veterana]NKY87833.1 RNA polymerase subunit sigma-70 [Nocardia veterana]